MAASRAPRLDLGIRNNTIIRSGMKSILNFRHKIEKYGFKCLEFGNAHPWGLLDGTIDNSTIKEDPFYYGPLRGFDVSVPRPITVTYNGCVEICGSGPNPRDTLTAFQILTTWVLPAIALLAQLPY